MLMTVINSRDENRAEMLNRTSKGSQLADSSLSHLQMTIVQILKTGFLPKGVICWEYVLVREVQVCVVGLKRKEKLSYYSPEEGK